MEEKLTAVGFARVGVGADRVDEIPVVQALGVVEQVTRPNGRGRGGFVIAKRQ
ncbi:hypothetical protein ACFU8R_08240 [Pseudonocardia alni]|uniref:hypothetical protein n=1 Tax=Pseudonocardia alni TaxID=33907 RepID=UPI0033FDFEC7